MGCARRAYLEDSVLGLNGDYLVADKLQYAVDNRLETLQDLFVCECHVTFFNTGLGELRFNSNINSPFLAIVPEVCFYPIFKVHNALRVDLAGSL